MKIIKYLFSTIFGIILIACAAVIYDLAYYDPSYVNRNSITFSKQNINSKKIRKFYSHIEKIPYKLGYSFLDSHKEFWKIEDHPAIHVSTFHLVLKPIVKMTTILHTKKMTTQR